jgi:hypothetical protein
MEGEEGRVLESVAAKAAPKNVRLEAIVAEAWLSAEDVEDRAASLLAARTATQTCRARVRRVLWRVLATVGRVVNPEKAAVVDIFARCRAVGENGGGFDDKR